MINFYTIYLLDTSGSMIGLNYSIAKNIILQNSKLTKDFSIITFNNLYNETTYIFNNINYDDISIVLSNIKTCNATFAQYIIINIYDLISKQKNNYGTVFIIYFISDGKLHDLNEFKSNILNFKKDFDSYSIIMNAVFINGGDINAFDYFQLFNNINISNIYKIKTIDEDIINTISNDYKEMINPANYKIIYCKKFPWDNSKNTISVVHKDFIELDKLYNSNTELYINTFTINLLKSYILSNKKLNYELYPDFIYDMLKYLIHYKPWKFISGYLKIFEIESICKNKIINNTNDINNTIDDTDNIINTSIINDTSTSINTFIRLNNIPNDFKTSDLSISNAKYFMIFSNDSNFNNILRVSNTIKKNVNTINIFNPTNDEIFIRISVIPNIFGPIYTYVTVNNEILITYNKLGFTYIERMNSGNISIHNQSSDIIRIFETNNKIKLDNELIINSKIESDTNNLLQLYNINKNNEIHIKDIKKYNNDIIIDKKYIDQIKDNNKKRMRRRNKIRKSKMFNTNNITCFSSRTPNYRNSNKHDNDSRSSLIIDEDDEDDEDDEYDGIDVDEDEEKVECTNIRKCNSIKGTINHGAIITKKIYTQHLNQSDKNPSDVKFNKESEMTNVFIIYTDQDDFESCNSNIISKYNELYAQYNIPKASVHYIDSKTLYIENMDVKKTKTVATTSVKIRCPICNISNEKSQFYCPILYDLNAAYNKIICGHIVCKQCGDKLNENINNKNKCYYCRSRLHNDCLYYTVNIEMLVDTDSD